MFDPTKPVQTRDGRRARILSVFDDIKLRHGDTLVGVVESEVESGKWELRSWKANGVYDIAGEQSDEDLVNAPETVTRRVYLYVDGNKHIVSSAPPLTTNAEPAASVDVTFEIGEFADGDL